MIKQSSGSSNDLQKKQSVSEDLLKAFVDRSKKSQQQRDRRKIQELEEVIKLMENEHEKLQRQYNFVKQHLEQEISELRLTNIKLDAQGKAAKNRVIMLQGIIKDTNERNVKPSLSQQAAYRLLEQENRQLKKLLKQMMFNKV